ncbi:MAG: type II toxin-antitoxin system PrlF family antitoxin [Candidatus Acidiferrales bacterium]
MSDRVASLHKRPACRKLLRLFPWQRKHKCANLHQGELMRKTRVKKSAPRNSNREFEGTEYRGKQAKTGNSLGFRFDRALFRSHPEFNGEVRAKIIAPGRMLVSAENAVASTGRKDVVVAAFLAFLAKDMQRNPGAIAPLDSDLTRRIDSLTDGVSVSADEDLGDEALI